MRLTNHALLVLLGGPLALLGCVTDTAEEKPSDTSSGGADNVLNGGTPGSGGGTAPDELGSGGTASGGLTSESGGQPSGGAASGGAASGGEPGTGGSTPIGSDGCGMSAGQDLKSWVGSTAGERSYDIWLPENYDPARAYPVILLLHGCGGSMNNVPLQDQTGADSIVIRGAGSGADNCWDDTADLPYIDAMLEDVKARFCVNADHLFAVGYSSGSWVASKLSCVRGDVFRGIATVTGGEPGGIQGCSGQVGRMYVHDNTDGSNLIEWDRPSRDRMVQTNNCSGSTVPVEPSPCVEYQDCDPGYPVVWCETSGQGHSRQDSLAAPAFWDFFQSLMDE